MPRTVENNNLYESTSIKPLIDHRLNSAKKVSVVHHTVAKGIDDFLQVTNFRKEGKQPSDEVTTILDDKINYVPYMLNGNHFALLVINRNDKPAKIWHQDSLGQPIAKGTVAALKTWFGNKYPDAEFDENFVDMKVKQQTNTLDCGPYTVLNAVEISILLGKDPKVNSDAVKEKLHELSSKDIEKQRSADDKILNTLGYGSSDSAISSSMSDEQIAIPYEKQQQKITKVVGSFYGILEALKEKRHELEENKVDSTLIDERIKNVFESAFQDLAEVVTQATQQDKFNIFDDYEKHREELISAIRKSEPSTKEIIIDSPEEKNSWEQSLPKFFK